jgi:hypothetical protein
MPGRSILLSSFETASIGTTRSSPASPPGGGSDGAGALATTLSGAGEPLRGVPFGVKDVIDTADLPTEHGSEAYAGN